MGKTTIEYLDYTWNPVTGCTPISTGCKHCWAQEMTERFADVWGYDFTPQFHEDRLEIPQTWKRPGRIGVSFMGDLFHKNIKNEEICYIFQTIMTCYQHTFIFLTKRPERMREFINGWRWRKFDCCKGIKGIRQLPKNIWLGISVENQNMLKERLPFLAQIKEDSPNTTTFLSYEPALGPIDIYPRSTFNEHTIKWNRIPYFAFLDWIICGCESGASAREMDLSWVVSIKNQCVQMKIPFFLKQMKVNNKLIKMPELGGQVWDQMPKGV